MRIYTDIWEKRECINDSNGDPICSVALMHLAAMLQQPLLPTQSHYSHISLITFLSHCCFYCSSLCVCVCTRHCQHVSTGLCKCVYVRAHSHFVFYCMTHSYKHTHAHTHTHTHTHTQQSILGHCIVLIAADGSRGLKSFKLLAFLSLSLSLSLNRVAVRQM